MFILGCDLEGDGSQLPVRPFGCSAQLTPVPIPENQYTARHYEVRSGNHFFHKVKS